ncbi:MAG: sensor histidine kinase [Candidatus Xenobiia bacterium LiM19]
MDNNRKGPEHHLILLGILFGLLYWFLESAIRAYIFYENTFIEEVLTRDPYEIWMRCLVVFILVIFAAYVQHILKKLKETELKLKKAREEFVAILTHDLKSPLSSIMAYSQLVGDLRAGEISEKKRHFVQIIQKSCEVMLSMINNIVSASKLEDGMMDYHHEDFSLSELFTELTNTFIPLAESGSISLELSCPPDVYAKGDRTKLRQVFYNLISNALRYTQEGGRIYAAAVPQEARISIEVSDTGRGIPENMLKAVFQKFVQTKGERAGSGLGLYIVKSFLEGHGSNVTIESSPDTGTRFLFTIPAGKNATPAV